MEIKFEPRIKLNHNTYSCSFGRRSRSAGCVGPTTLVGRPVFGGSERS